MRQRYFLALCIALCASIAYGADDFVSSDFACKGALWVIAITTCKTGFNDALTQYAQLLGMSEDVAYFELLEQSNEVFKTQLELDTKKYQNPLCAMNDFFIKKGADSQRCKNFFLLKAVERNLLTEVFILLNTHQADANTTNFLGTSVLAIAAGNSSIEMVDLLMKHKANPNGVPREKSRMSQAHMPLKVALHNKNRAMVRLLLGYGASDADGAAAQFLAPVAY